MKKTIIFILFLIVLASSTLAFNYGWQNDNIVKMYSTTVFNGTTNNITNNYNSGISTIQSTDSYILVQNGTTTNVSANISKFDLRYLQNGSSPTFNSITILNSPSGCVGGTWVTSWQGNQSICTGMVVSDVTTLGFNTTSQLDGRYAPISEPVASSLGNWSKDKSSYNTTNQLYSYFYDISNPAGFYNSTTIPTYALISNLVSYVGNWSLDKPNYNTTSQLNTLYAPINWNPFNQVCNTTSTVTFATQIATTENVTNQNINGGGNLTFNGAGTAQIKFPTGILQVIDGSDWQLQFDQADVVTLASTATMQLNGTTYVNKALQMNGNITIGTSQGFYKMANCSISQPTCNAGFAGNMCYNYTGNKLMLCNSTAWRTI